MQKNEEKKLLKKKAYRILKALKTLFALIPSIEQHSSSSGRFRSSGSINREERAKKIRETAVQI